MKKIIGIAIIALSFCSAKSFAQIQKGNILVGGDLASLHFGSGGYFNVNIDPKAAFFIKDNVAIGPYVNFGLTTAKDQSTITTYGVGGFARYYLNDPKTNVLKHGRLFFEGNVGIEGNNTHSTSTNGLGLGIGPGYAYFITPNIGLETLLKYDGILGFGSQATSNNVDLSVGFQIYLPGKKAREIVNDVK
ncbi:MAG: hypothetical protein M3Z26_03395 [Bacteroidota bacterium]|nr:hypothetical protein [Bacteroidota bacterium]